MKIKFGINEKNTLSGADLYVRIFQITSLVPMIYVFVISGYSSLLAKKNPLAVLFDLGVSAMPRGETLLMSLGYRKTNSEILVFLAALIFALAFGIISNKLLNVSGKGAIITRYVFIVLIIADLVLRLLPLHYNGVFPVYAAVFGFAVRIICLLLIILDLIKAK